MFEACAVAVAACAVAVALACAVAVAAAAAVSIAPARAVAVAATAAVAVASTVGVAVGVLVGMVVPVGVLVGVTGIGLLVGVTNTGVGVRVEGKDWVGVGSKVAVGVPGWSVAAVAVGLRFGVVVVSMGKGVGETSRLNGVAVICSGAGAEARPMKPKQ